MAAGFAPASVTAPAEVDSPGEPAQLGPPALRDAPIGLFAEAHRLRGRHARAAAPRTITVRRTVPIAISNSSPGPTGAGCVALENPDASGDQRPDSAATSL